MTHTLHREGSESSLADDYPMLSLVARGYNDKGTTWRVKKILEMAARYPIVNFGDMANGSKFVIDLQKILATDKELSIMHMVFNNKEDMTAFMKDLKAADLGISMVASGLFQEIFKCCKKAGLKPHTVNYSLGIHGRTEKLPPTEILELTTMCGHSLVTASLAKQMIKRIKKGKETPEKAAAKLAKNCLCGIFNPERAARLLRLAAG